MDRYHELFEHTRAKILSKYEELGQLLQWEDYGRAKYIANLLWALIEDAEMFRDLAKMREK